MDLLKNTKKIMDAGWFPEFTENLNETLGKYYDYDCELERIDFVPKLILEEEAEALRMADPSIGHASALATATKKLTGVSQNKYESFLANLQHMMENDYDFSPVWDCPTPRLDFSSIQSARKDQSLEEFQPKHWLEASVSYLRAVSIAERSKGYKGDKRVDRDSDETWFFESMAYEDPSLPDLFAAMLISQYGMSDTEDESGIQEYEKYAEILKISKKNRDGAARGMMYAVSKLKRKPKSIGMDILKLYRGFKKEYSSEYASSQRNLLFHRGDFTPSNYFVRELNDYRGVGPLEYSAGERIRVWVSISESKEDYNEFKSSCSMNDFRAVFTIGGTAGREDRVIGYLKGAYFNPFGVDEDGDHYVADDYVLDEMLSDEVLKAIRERLMPAFGFNSIDAKNDITNFLLGFEENLFGIDNSNVGAFVVLTDFGIRESMNFESLWEMLKLARYTIGGDFISSTQNVGSPGFLEYEDRVQKSCFVVKAPVCYFARGDYFDRGIDRFKRFWNNDGNACMRLNSISKDPLRPLLAY